MQIRQNDSVHDQFAHSHNYILNILRGNLLRAARIIFPTWLEQDHLVKRFSYKEVQFKIVVALLL